MRPPFYLTPFVLQLETFRYTNIFREDKASFSSVAITDSSKTTTTCSFNVGEMISSHIDEMPFAMCSQNSQRAATHTHTQYNVLSWDWHR